ncbi:hypothetical protein T484DRAFT_1839070 [Baffinella frigidus]|nr:hypothetical protein T484DRAFT_1839070 [Cryptophyta sp. CCMP2293]
MVEDEGEAGGVLNSGVVELRRECEEAFRDNSGGVQRASDAEALSGHVLDGALGYSIDVWVPSLSLCVEVDGPSHFVRIDTQGAALVESQGASSVDSPGASFVKSRGAPSVGSPGASFIKSQRAPSVENGGGPAGGANGDGQGGHGGADLALDGPSRLKRRHLEAAGLTVLSVPFWEWDVVAASTAEARREWLWERLPREG